MQWSPWHLDNHNHDTFGWSQGIHITQVPLQGMTEVQKVSGYMSLTFTKWSNISSKIQWDPGPEVLEQTKQPWWVQKFVKQLKRTLTLILFSVRNKSQKLVGRFWEDRTFCMLLTPVPLKMYSNFGWPKWILVGQMVKLLRKWPMAGCYF